MSKKQNRGFTLIELLIVVIIVAVLAAVAVPLMSGNVMRARATECESALGTVRTALRAYYAEHSTYVVEDADSDITEIPGISAGDLDGQFFTEGCYTVSASGTSTFTATCDWDSDSNGAPKADEVDDPARTTTIIQDGTITHTPAL